MSAAISFICPVHIKGFHKTVVSPEMGYLLTTDAQQESSIIAQLSHLFELELEVLTDAVWAETPEIVLTYDHFEEDWEFTGDKEDPAAMKFMYELAQSVQTGETDDEMLDKMEERGWSSTEALQAGVLPMLELMGRYPYFWRAIKYDGQEWIKPYFEQASMEQAGQMVTRFYLDIQEIAHFAQRATKEKLLWFAKVELPHLAQTNTQTAQQ